MAYIIVEGKTDKVFIQTLCNSLNIENVIIKDIHGIGGFNKALESLNPELEKGEKILAILDADSSYEDRKTEIENIIDDKGVEFFLFPNDRDNGELETLILSSIENENKIVECFEEYIKCLVEKGIDIRPINNKAKLYAYTTLEHNLTPEKYLERINLNNEKFNKIKEFLSDKLL